MNLTDLILLAAADVTEDLTPPVGRLRPDIDEYLIVLGAMAFVAICAALWIVYTRKRQRHHRHHRRHHHRQQDSGGNATSGLSSEAASGAEDRPRRRRRRGHRPRNPTLAQTGGLPPVRSDDPPVPPQSQTQPQ